MNFKKCLLLGVVWTATALRSPAWAGPVLVLDLQVAGNSTTTPSGVHGAAGGTAGQVITLQLWGTVRDDPAYSGITPATTAGDGIVSAAMRFIVTEGGVSGNYINGVKNTSGGFSTGSNGAQKNPNYDSSGGLDWGGAAPVDGIATSQTNYLVASAINRVAFTSGTSVLLGTIQWQVGANPAGISHLNVVPFISGATGRSQYNFMIGGTIYNNAVDPASANRTAVDTNQRIKAGPGVFFPILPTFDPEPGSLAVLGVGGLALLARRRR